MARARPRRVGGRRQRDSIRLAFVAALQHLPARRRAVLILRDVLRWSAAGSPEPLDTTTAAVNSALQRRAQLADRGLTGDTVDATSRPSSSASSGYVDAFWRKRTRRLDRQPAHRRATWDMPPFTSWFKALRNIGWLIGNEVPRQVHRHADALPTRANGQPAYGLYMRTPAGDFVPFQLQVLELDSDRVRRVTAFFDHRLFETFGLRHACRPTTCRSTTHRPAGDPEVLSTLSGSVGSSTVPWATPCPPRRRPRRRASAGVHLRRLDARRTCSRTWRTPGRSTEAAGGAVDDAAPGAGPRRAGSQRCRRRPVCAARRVDRPRAGDVVLVDREGGLDLDSSPSSRPPPRGDGAAGTSGGRPAGLR